MGRFILGILVVAAGAVLGLYLGLWVCFIGGFVDIVNEVKSDVVEVGPIAWGLIKIMIASFVGWLAFLMVTIIGFGLIVGPD